LTRKGWLIIALFLLILYSFLLSKNLLGIGHSGASPINPSFKGTGLMVSYLKGEGYRVRIVYQADISELGMGGVLIIVSPERNFTPNELSFAREAYSRNYSLIIADEGPYSNTLLNYLRIPIEITTTPYFLRNSYPKARVEISGKEFVLDLAYASGLKVSGNARPIGWCDNEVVAATYKASNEVKVIVLGDGSVFTNAALTPPNPFNPYVQFLNSIIKAADEGRPKELLILASPYPERPMSVEEMITAGYSPIQVWAALINPFRAGLSIIQVLSRPSPLSALIYGILLSITLLIVRSALKPPKHSFSIFRASGSYWNERALIKALCTEMPSPLSFEECVKIMKAKNDREVVKEINDYLRRKCEIIPRIIEFLQAHM